MTATTTEPAMSETPDISVVIPLLNESESLPELAAWIDRVMTANRFRYEAIFIDDGSSDTSWNVIRSLSATNPSVRGIRFRRNYGKSAALYCGFEAARGEVVITMDADLQDSPDEIPELYRMITEEGYDLVSGWKRRRHDPIGKRWPSKLFNATARATSGIRLHDFNCGLKAYRKKVVKSIEVYGEMHRYIPILAKNAGFTRIGEKEVHTVHASTATANSAGNAPSKATSTSSRSCSCRASGAVRCTFSADWAR